MYTAYTYISPLSSADNGEVQQPGSEPTVTSAE